MVWSRSMRSSRDVIVLMIGASVVLTSGCSRGEPPSPPGVDASVAPLPAPSTVGAATAAGSASVPAPDAGARATASSPDGGDPGALPQTRDRPKAEGAAFDARAAALWDAIVRDEADRAMPFFFPLPAYEQVKDVGSPAADWRRRLVAAYKRDIHALHARLGDRAEQAKLVRIDVPDDRARWVDPGEEYNKIGYWRVYGTRIVYTTTDGGRERAFDVSSLISWRGEWYVVHLTGFK